MPDKTLIANRIKKSRLNAGYHTKSKAAVLLGIADNCYRNYELMYRIPELDTLEKMGALFNVNPAYLLGWTNDPHPYTR